MAAHDALSRRERKKIELEQRIRECAAALFHAKGYEATTVDEIAEAADVAKATLFNYFPRKDALLLAVWEDGHEAVLEQLGAPEDWTGTAEARLRRLFHTFAEAAELNPGLSRVMAIEAMRSFWARAEESPFEQIMNELVEDLVREAQERGEMRQDTEPRVVMSLLRGLYGMTLVEWLREEAPGSRLRDELDAKFDVMFRGLSAVEGAGKGGSR
jgi:TetR/AcrR family transcriptional regulator, cholesterol catabolism regulator